MPAHFGLDISSSSIKVAQTKATNNGFDLMAFGEIKTPAPLQSANHEDDEAIAAAIKQLINESAIHTKDVYIAMPESQVYTRVIQLPYLSEQELENVIKFEAEQYIPIPLDDVYLQHQSLSLPPKNSQQKMDVLLVAAKKNAVEKVVRVVQSIGLTPIVMETALLSSLRALESQLDGNVMLVDIGNTSTDIALLQKGILKQTSSLTTAGDAITRSIAESLSLNEEQARQYKHTYGLDTNQLEGKVAKAIEPPMTAIINHIVKNIRFARSLGTEGRIDKLVVSGGSALMPYLTTHLVDKLNVEVSIANPLQNCKNSNLPQTLVTSATRFASVIGLALRD